MAGWLVVGLYTSPTMFFVFPLLLRNTDDIDPPIFVLLQQNCLRRWRRAKSITATVYTIDYIPYVAKKTHVYSQSPTCADDGVFSLAGKLGICRRIPQNVYVVQLQVSRGVKDSCACRYTRTTVGSSRYTSNNHFGNECGDHPITRGDHGRPCLTEEYFVG